MAQNAPPSQDVQDIQFKLHGKFNIFPEIKEPKSLVSLLAVSSAKGLLFAGNPDGKELKVFKLKEVVDAKTTGQELKARVVNLSGEAKSLACSCDGSMLAVNYFHNNTGFLQIFQVDSFVSPKINSLYNLPVAPESNVFALQLLWNPVIANNIALILSDGSVAMFTLNNGGQYDKVTLGKEHQVKSGCWSPKGKQIVFGFAEGKLQQFKPNLQPARAIPCPPSIHPGPFDCIALHWLSTYQFAAVFLQRGQDMCPSLFIVNAPKAGQPSYINYYDICYSAPGPRIQQLSFTHIAQWNLLLVTSANGVEVGVLGTRETGENPKWIQYTLLDEARIEMPLTDTKDETYPMGFTYDTSAAHQIVIGEKTLPVMPMIHVLSTHGHMVSYNFLNLTANAVDVCSPPPPLNDMSGQFKPLSETMASSAPVGSNQIKAEANKSEQLAVSKAQSAGEGFGDMTFTLGSNMVTSTPAIKDKPAPLFGGQVPAAKPLTNVGFTANTVAATATTATANKSASGFGFGTTPQQFGSITSGTSFGGFTGSTGFPGKPSEMGSSSQQPATQTANANKNAEMYKPLYAVPATFTPPPVQQPIKSDVKPIKPTVVANKINLNSGELDEVVKKMIVIQIEAFETELKQIRQQSKQLLENIGSPDEIKPFTKELNDLQEIIEQANDHEFEQDVQSLRHAMNESYAMLAECRTKLDLYNNPNLTRLSTVSTSDPTSRRQLAKLQAYVAANKNQFSQLNQLIEAQWSQYQDVVRRNSKNQMHIPCLDGIYQRMSKLKDLLARQRNKMNCIKTKLKQKGLNYQPPSDLDVTSKAVEVLTKNQSTMESLADSILSMSLSQVVAQTHAKLSDEKLKALRNFTKQQQQIAIIKPKRPDRVDLKSEVILETKLETERKQKEIVKKLQQRQQQQQQVQQQHQQQYIQQQQQQQQQQYIQQQQQQQQQYIQQQQQQQQYIQQHQQQQYMQQQQQQQQYMVNKTPINLQQKSQPNANYQASLQQQLLRPQATMVQTQQQQQPVIAKPTASKPSMVTSQPPVFITPTSSTSATISFGGNSSFVKTSQTTSITKTEEVSKTTASSTPFIGGFGMPQQATHNIAQPKPLQATTSVSSESKENVPLTTPISFSAKVIGGNDTKTFSNLANKTNTINNMVQPPISQGFAAATSTSGFSAFATTKPVATAKGTQDKNENKQPDEAPKTASNVTTSSTTSVTTTPFGGFGGSTTKTTVSSTPATSSQFSTPLFGSNSSSNNTPVSTPFSGQPFSSSAFSFTAATSTPSTAPSAVENTTAKAVTNTGQTTAPGGKTTEVKTTLTSSTTPTTAATPTSSGALNLVTSKAPAAPNVTIISSGLPAQKPAASAPTSSNTPTPTAATDPTDSLFGSLNICKPTPKIAGDSNKSGNIFSGFATSGPTVTPGSFAFASASGAGDGAKSFFSSTTTTASTPSTEFTACTADSVFGKPSTTATATTAPADSTTITTTTSTSVTSVASSAPSTAAAPAPAPVTATATSSFPFAATATSSASTAGSLFDALSLTASTTGTSTNTTPTTTSSDGSIFGGGTSVFGQSSTAAVTSTTTSLFGGGAAVASSAPSLFGSTAPAATTAATPGSGSIFAAAATPQSAGNIFGGIPKPEQSVFGGAGTASQPAGTGLFAAAAANTNPPAASGGSIFGGASSTGFGSSTAGGSIFGGSSTSTSPFAANAAANSAGSIFAAAAATTKPPESGGNLFGSPTQQSAASGGSIFGKSTFGGMATTQPSGNIFGASTTQSPTSGGFGASGGSIFGGGSSMSNTGTSGGSIFGAAAAATAPTFASGFGAFSQPTTAAAFASPTGSGGFAASSTAPFGSPQQQSAFAKPMFGGPATFGSPTPAFAAQPTFGGAATFGSSKGFGSFAATSPASPGFGAPASPGFGAPAQASPAPNGNIFETLGSQDSGLSFGNLAHTGQAPQPKPTFGGVSFLNYRS